MNNEFAGRIMAFDKKGEGDENQDDGTLIEVTTVTQSGLIELAFNDRNERCYLKFKLSDLMTALCFEKGDADTGAGASRS